MDLAMRWERGAAGADVDERAERRRAEGETGEALKAASMRGIELA